LAPLPKLERKMITIFKMVDGVQIRFSVEYQPKYKADKDEGYWLKVINVTDGVGFGPAPDWPCALEFARELAGSTSKWHVARRAACSLR
jgi:hypothetical protein